MFRHLSRSLAALVALILVLAACGDGTGSSATPEDPNEAILAAFSDLDPTTVDVTFSIEATGAQLAEAMEAELTGDPSEQAILDLLTQAEVRLVSSDQAMSFALTVDGSTIAEFRMIDRTAYVRLDVDSVVNLATRIDPEAGAELTGQLDMVPFMFGDEPQMSFLGDLLTGSWVSLEIPADSELGDMWDSNTDPETVNEDFAEAVSQIVDENSTVTAAGEARGGDRFLVQVQMADLVAALRTHPVTSEALELSDADLDSILDEMREEGIAEVWELDVVLIDGQLSSILFDVANLVTDMPEGSTLPLLITLNLSPSAPSAPAEHTPVPTELLEEFFAGFPIAA